MNLLIELAIELALRLAGTGMVVVTDFSKDGNAIYQVEVNGDVYAYNPTMGWFMPDIGDYAPGKYEGELRNRLIQGALYTLRQGKVVHPPAAEQEVKQPQPKTHNAYRIPDAHKKGAPLYAEEPCRRCKGKGVMPYSVDDGICYWCEGDGLQATGWATHGPQS
jgi:hypothetical protein